MKKEYADLKLEHELQSKELTFAKTHCAQQLDERHTLIA